jgi:hypothetical protein
LSGGCGVLRFGDDRGRRFCQVERLVDVVIETFAEQQQRLASALDVAQPVRDVLDRLQRPARVESPLRVVRVLDGFRFLDCIPVVSLLRPIREHSVVVHLAEVNGQFLGAGGRELLTLKPVDRRLQQSRAARQLLS